MKIRRRRYAPCPDAGAALTTVRELSERCTLRPAPRGLRPVPVQKFTAPSAPPVWQFRRDLLISLAENKA